MAQSEYLKQYKKDHKDKVSKWRKKYYDEHAEDLRAKRRAKYRKEQNARLVSLITDYVEGMTIKELCGKYNVNYRRE